WRGRRPFANLQIQGMTMNQQQFIELAQQSSGRIPVTRTILADLETPVSTYLKLARGPYSYLFESVEGGEKWGRYSFIGLPAATVLKVFGNNIQREEGGQVVESRQVADPLGYVEDFYRAFPVVEVAGLPRFNG